MIPWESRTIFLRGFMSCLRLTCLSVLPFFGVPKGIDLPRPFPAPLAKSRSLVVRLRV
jgi:hypothetical protein